MKLSVPIYRNAETPVTRLVLRRNSSYAASGRKVRLKFNGGNYQLYRDAARTMLVGSEVSQFDLLQDRTLYLKGTTKSASRGGEKVTLQYLDDDGWQDGEKVLLTVVQAEFVIQVKAFIPYAWTDPEGITVWGNPLYGKVVKGDSRSFRNLYSDNPNDKTNNPIYLAAPFRVCQTAVLTPYKDLHSSQFLESHFVTAPKSSHYVKATSVDPSEINLIHGSILPHGEPSKEGKPGTGFVSCQEDQWPYNILPRTAGVTIEGSGKDGAMGLIEPFTADIHWYMRLSVSAMNPLNPFVQAIGRHDKFPSYEIICLQADGTYTDIDQFAPNSNDVPGPSTLGDIFSVPVNKSKTIQ
jgi:hypothetical protein